jgi:hypothetical protein
MSLALMLLNRDKGGDLHFCFLDKDWRLVGMDR